MHIQYRAVWFNSQIQYSSKWGIRDWRYFCQSIFFLLPSSWGCVHPSVRHWYIYSNLSASLSLRQKGITSVTVISIGVTFAWLKILATPLALVKTYKQSAVSFTRTSWVMTFNCHAVAAHNDLVIALSRSHISHHRRPSIIPRRPIISRHCNYDMRLHAWFKLPCLEVT